MNLKPTRRLAYAAAAAGMAAVSLSGCLIADKTSQVITVAGSDTTENVMAGIVAAENADTAYNTDPDDLQNVLSVQATAKTVPADANCASITYHTPAGPGEVVSPNGSSAGRNALKASVQAGDGCIDVARSSGPPRAIPSDLATFEYYAFGLDALGWASASTKAPANMTLTQLRSVYNCTFTDWSQVGGTAGPIQRYHPQILSGTCQFFRDDVLGFDPTTFSGPSCPASISTQENSGELIAANGDQEEALVGYSMANWIAQARGTAPEQRSGQTLRNLNGQNLVTFPGGVPTPNTAGPVKETNVKLVNPTPAYPGIRFVFNVVDSTSVNYNQAMRYVGFENRANVEPEYAMSSPLCGGLRQSIINSYGFGELDATAGSSNVPGTHCRQYKP
jgi:phosphate transport system substrate-binding protein